MGRGAWKRGDFSGATLRWQTNWAGSGQAITDGATKTTKDPTALAIAAQAAFAAGINEAITSGRWAAGLQRAGKQGWVNGITNFVKSGAMQAKAQQGGPHVLAFAQAYGQQLMSQVQQLPPRGPRGSNQQRSAQINGWAHSVRGRFRKVWRGGGG